MSESHTHEVKQGDCISKIASEHGLTWKQIWNDSKNASLKKQRKDPNVLMPGDVVHIPQKKEKKKDKATGQKHDFKRKKENSRMQLRLMIDGEPLRSLNCTLEIPNQPPRTGRINGNGDVEIDGKKNFTVPSKATFAKLLVGDPPAVTTYTLRIGHLNPHDETTGIQQRLRNLGYDCGVADGNVGPRTEFAIQRFQRDHELKDTGKITKRLMKKLQEQHGS